MILTYPWQTNQAASLFPEPNNRRLGFAQPMRVCISYSSIRPHCPPPWTNRCTSSSLAEPAQAAPNKGNTFLQACDCFTAPAHRPALRVRHTALEPALLCLHPQRDLPTLCLKRPWPTCGWDNWHSSRKVDLFSQSLFASWVGKQSGWVAGWPDLAAVPGGDEQRDGGTAGSCPSTTAWHSHNPAPFHLPAVGLGVLHAAVCAEAAPLCSGKWEETSFPVGWSNLRAAYAALYRHTFHSLISWS